MMSLIKFICCILTFSMLITYIYGDYNDDVSNTISSGCYPDLHVPMTNSYPSIFIDQTANIPLSQSNWDSNLCHITSIPLAFKLAVGVNNVKFNSSFILPAISRYSTTITLPVNPALFIQDDNLPGYLVVREINSGNGFKPASLTDGRVPVAIVYERPKVYTSSVKIYRTQTIQLRISGEGFTDRFSKMSLMFSPNIGYESIDYTVTVLNREELIVTLLDGRR